MNPDPLILDQPDPQPTHPTYDSIGGWLILIAIGLVITPIRLGYSILVELLPVFEPETWNYLTSPDSPVYHHLWKPLIWFEVLGNAFFMAFAIVLMFFFFGKRKLLPRLFIIYLVSNLVFVLGDYYMASQIPMLGEMDMSDSFREIGRSILSVGIWVPYFLLSERVRGTFVH